MWVCNLTNSVLPRSIFLKYPWNILTITRSISITAGQTGRAGNPLSHTEAHVTSRRWLESVNHEARAVPHGDVQLPDAAFPVLVDAGDARHDALLNRGHSSWNSDAIIKYNNKVQFIKYERFNPIPVNLTFTRILAWLLSSGGAALYTGFWWLTIASFLVCFLINHFTKNDSKH